MIIHTFHPRSPLRFTSLHFTSLHFTTLHFPFFTPLHFWPFRHHASQNPSLLLTYNYSPNTLSKNVWFAVESRWRLCSQFIPQFDCPIYKGVFTDVCMRIVRTYTSFSTAGIRFETSSSSRVQTHYTVLCYSYHAFSYTDTVKHNSCCGAKVPSSGSLIMTKEPLLAQVRSDYMCRDTRYIASFSRTISLWIMYRGRCVYTQPRN